MDIDKLEAGREMDALIAEKVFGWRKVKGPKTDYNGPCESFDVLIPPSIDDPFPFYPPKGAVPPYYFCRKWSTDIALAFEVVEALKQQETWLTLTYLLEYFPGEKTDRWVWQAKFRGAKHGIGYANEIPLAITSAALKAV